MLIFFFDDIFMDIFFDVIYLMILILSNFYKKHTQQYVHVKAAGQFTFWSFFF